MVGKGRGEDGGGLLLCAGGCQPEGRRGRGEETWGSWRVVRAGRPAAFVLLSVCPQEGLVCGVLRSCLRRPQIQGPVWGSTPGRRLCGLQTSEQDVWPVVRWRATQPPTPFLGFGGLFLDTFVQISRPLTASQVAWF